MDKKEEIVMMLQGTQNYMQGINIEELKRDYSREELIELKDTLFKIRFRSLVNELSKVIDEKTPAKHKKLSPYNYPILYKMDFVLNEKRVELDQHLASLHLGDSLTNLALIFTNPKERVKVIDWLLEHRVIDVRHYALCPTCEFGDISHLMTTEKREETKKLFHRYKDETFIPLTDLHLKELKRILGFDCTECEKPTDFTKMDELSFKTIYRLDMERDK